MMKKIAYLFAAACMFAACGGNQQKAANAPADSTSFEEQQIKAGMNAHLDSLTAAWLRMKPSPVYSTTKDGKIKLTDEEKKVKPDYLFSPDDLQDKMETLSSKYRALAVYFVDREVANLYGMYDVYTPVMKKIAGELNDPAIKYIYENGDKEGYEDLNKKAYEIEEENGRANRFWEVAATSIIEQTYILCQNDQKFLENFTDKDAEDITYRTTLLVNSFEDLQQYNPELLNIYNVIQPLGRLNAISVDQLREQLKDIKDDVVKARESLFM